MTPRKGAQKSDIPSARTFAPTLAQRCPEPQIPPSGHLRQAPRAAQEAVAAVWAEILRERHPNVSWEVTMESSEESR